MSKRKVNVAIIGLGFGAEFIPIYQRHPNANMYAICQRNREEAERDRRRLQDRQALHQVRGRAGRPQRRFRPHQLARFPIMPRKSIAALKAGKHVMCTVPMATTVEECRQIVELVQEDRPQVHDGRDGRLRPRVPVRQGAVRQGRAGQDPVPAGEPSAGHGRLAQLLARPAADALRHPLRRPVPGADAAREAEYVSCFGSGTIRKELIAKYNSPFAVETCHIKFRDSDLTARIYRSLFDTARQYRESFDVYGTKKTFEWQLIEGEEPVLHTAKKPEPEIPQRVKVPDYAHLLPEPIRTFTHQGRLRRRREQHLSFMQGGGHGGSHPHLVHEFLSALVEDRDPYPNAVQSANWTCVGICAHESALKGGEIVQAAGVHAGVDNDTRRSACGRGVAKPAGRSVRCSVGVNEP